MLKLNPGVLVQFFFFLVGLHIHKIKNIRDLYRGINDFNPRTNNVKDEEGVLLENCNIFWLYGRNLSLSYLVYMGLVILGRQIYEGNSKSKGNFQITR